MALILKQSFDAVTSFLRAWGFAAAIMENKEKTVSLKSGEKAQMKALAFSGRNA
jgi:hypothetical protein